MGSTQHTPQQQLIVDPSKQSQPYMSGAAEVAPQLLSPAELKLQSSQLTAEQLQGMLSHPLTQISLYHAVEHVKPMRQSCCLVGRFAARTGADESTRRAAEQRSLGHAMHAHLVEFLRSLLRAPGMEVSHLPPHTAQLPR